MDQDADIDWARVDQLRTEVGDEDFAEISELFLEEVVESVDALDASATPDALSSEMHALKGASLNLGFAKVARLAAAGEVAPETADVAAIRTACSGAIRAFQSRFPAG